MQWHHPTLSTRCFLTLDILSNVNKIKATEHFFLVALLIMLYKVVLTFESVDEILWCDHSNKSYWAVPSCGIVNYSVQGLFVETADEILWCDHSVKATEQYFPVVLFIMLYKVVLTFASVDEPLVWPFKWKLPEQYFPVVLLIMLCKVVQMFESVDEIQWWDLSNYLVHLMRQNWANFCKCVEKAECTCSNFCFTKRMNFLWDFLTIYCTMWLYILCVKS